jgi:deoxyuridine 5'-triphosphate nucleotidohydrolase
MNFQRMDFGAGVPRTPAPRRSPRGFLELVAASLCVWAAAYHTPAGALVQLGIARVRGTHSGARPLLAYYSGGTWDAAEVTVPTGKHVGPEPVEVGPQLGALAPLPALGRGVQLAWGNLSPQDQRPLAALADRHKVPLPFGKDEAKAADAIAEVLEKESKELGGSTDAAVLAAFAGHDTARFALGRARAEGHTDSLEELARWIPHDDTGALAAASTALSFGTAYALAWPLQQSARISSPFGYRIHPTTGNRQLHTGLDLAVPEKTQVRAVADGVVRRASEDALNGKVIIIDHGHGVSSAYCHNSELFVRTGDTIKAGQLLSASGNTGRSTGPHLHYQVELSRSPVDPLTFRAPPAAVAANERPMPIEEIEVQVKAVRDRVELEMPRYQTALSAGMDLQADLTDDIYIESLGRVLIATGLSFAIPEGWEGQIRPRSGMGHKQGLTVLNSPGTIDADFRGEVKVLLANLSNKSVIVRRGDRIAQLVFAPVGRATLVEVEELPPSERGEGGFGSTGT